MSCTNNELFTEVSSEQAAVIEGGLLTLKIHKITCIKAGADGLFGGGDDLDVYADGVLLNHPTMSMKSGKTRETSIEFNNFNFGKFGDSIIVDLFDNDSTSGDDRLGSFTARSTGGQVVSKRVSGSGSKYRIYYSAI